MYAVEAASPGPVGDVGEFPHIFFHPRDATSDPIPDAESSRARVPVSVRRTIRRPTGEPGGCGDIRVRAMRVFPGCTGLTGDTGLE